MVLRKSKALSLFHDTFLPKNEKDEPY